MMLRVGRIPYINCYPVYGGIECTAGGLCQPITLLVRERTNPRNFYRVVMMRIAGSPEVVKAKTSSWNI